MIGIGIGGWTYPPWRGVFYPKGLRQADELAWASRQLTAIEINATYHARQSPERFAQWAAATPEGFIFTVKASRFCTNRKVLADAGEAIADFLETGLAELGDRLGPVLWQFMPTKRFDPDDFAAFLALLPSASEGVRLRHCVEVRHPSFADPAFIALCRRFGVAVCVSDNADYPLIADVSANFVYARLIRGEDTLETGYADPALDVWADRVRAWADGGSPADLESLAGPIPKAPPRDVFAFFINAGKLRAPAAARALLRRLQTAPV